MTAPDTTAQILALDERISKAGERLARYKATDQPTSCAVLRGVIDRLLNEWLELMDERDH